MPPPESHSMLRCRVECTSTDKPKEEIKILGTTVFINPFETDLKVITPSSQSGFLSCVRTGAASAASAGHERT